MRNYWVKNLETGQFLSKMRVTFRRPVVKVQEKHGFFVKKASSLPDEFFEVAKPDFHDKIAPNQKGPSPLTNQALSAQNRAPEMKEFIR